MNQKRRKSIFPHESATQASQLKSSVFTWPSSVVPSWETNPKTDIIMSPTSKSSSKLLEYCDRLQPAILIELRFISATIILARGAFCFSSSTPREHHLRCSCIHYSLPINFIFYILEYHAMVSDILQLPGHTFLVSQKISVIRSIFTSTLLRYKLCWYYDGRWCFSSDGIQSYKILFPWKIACSSKSAQSALALIAAAISKSSHCRGWNVNRFDGKMTSQQWYCCLIYISHRRLS